MRIQVRASSQTKGLKTESETGERGWRVRLARFARVRPSRHPLPISLLILRKKPTVLQSTTIQALQAKAEEAMGKDSSQREKSEYENESDSEDE